MASVEMASLKPGASGHGAAAPHAPAHGAPKSVFRPNTFTVIAVLFQIFLIIIFGTCTSYVGSGYAGQVTPGNPLVGMNSNQLMGWAFTHVMMAIGFGFLYTLLRRYAWSGVSVNYLILAFAFQWGMLNNSFYDSVYLKWKGLYTGNGLETLQLSLTSMVRADYTVAAVLISFGAMIGRVSSTQMLVFLIWEVMNSTCNEFLGWHVLSVTDPGGSMYIHVFGAATGLAAAWFIGDKAKAAGKAPETSRHNGTFAMIGTLFLFVFWPFFNGANLTNNAQARAIFNTTMSIMASCGTAFAFSKAINRKFTDYDIQNATIAGGVAIGAACDMLVDGPWGSMLTGAVAGAVSVYGFNYLAAFLKEKLGITDVCSIASLHLMPGLIGGTASAIAAACVKVGPNADKEWSALAVDEEFPGRAAGRSALQQGGFQFAVTVITLVWGIACGLIGGWIITRPIFCPAEPAYEYYEDDAEFANVPPLSEEHHELLQEMRDMVAALEAKLERANSMRVALAAAAAPVTATANPVVKAAAPAHADADGVSLTSVAVVSSSETPSSNTATSATAM